MSPSTRNTRSAAAKKGNSKIEASPSRTSIGKQAGKRSAKSCKQTGPKDKDQVKKSVPPVEEARAASLPQLIHENASASDIASNTPINKSPFLPERRTSLFQPGFRPAIDNIHQPSPVNRHFQRRGTLFPTSPVKASPTTQDSISNLRRSIFEGTLPSVNSTSPGLISPATRGLASASSRGSIFGSPSVSSTLPMNAPTAGSAYASSPSGSNLGRIASVSSSPRLPKTPGTPQSPFASVQSKHAKVTVTASTKQEAEGVLARQQLVRESLFELREILTNLNWKVQQFEALADKAEKDVVWDTASAEGNLDEKDQGEEGLNSGKKLRFSFDEEM